PGVAFFIGNCAGAFRGTIGVQCWFRAINRECNPQEFRPRESKNRALRYWRVTLPPGCRKGERRERSCHEVTAHDSGALRRDRDAGSLADGGADAAVGAISAALVRS